MKKPTVCAYYFPNWHSDPRNDKWHGTGWTEWEVVKCARPRFPGHQQPKVPIWGYEDESDPAVMAKKIDAATQHGVDGFLFDWYWFFDGGFRLKCLEEGFLKAPNSTDMKFAVMWANHDPICVHPGSRMYPKPSLLDGGTSPETFLKATNHCIATYFKHPNHLRLNGGLYFSIYSFDRMIDNLGGEEATKEIFRDFRSRVARAGLGDLHLNAITSIWRKEEDYPRLERLGVDSFSSYNWSYTAETFPFSDYDYAERQNTLDYETLTRRCKMP
ncbi:MAG: glycoside hydrolase family 99-like domain-containing protein, partial [Kiritimatiellia bacterium]|nr:glycoside hydrolase family 99-like domain-containing protein [Kiritimatiellia bacterium]